MSLKPTGPDYLEAPHRRCGMDHDFYDWRDSHGQSRFQWQGNIRLGVWIQLAVEWFPLNISGQPFLPTGAPNRPYPDTQTYTARDYGNRIGIYRIIAALRAGKATASAFVNARLAQRYPLLLRHLLDEGYEMVVAGLDAGAIHHEGLGEAEERAMIAEALGIFTQLGVVPVAWHSPSWSQSTRTPRLLVEAGVPAMADWPNDESPYPFRTSAGTLISLPAAYELSDRKILIERLNPLADYEDQIRRAFRRLRREAAECGDGRLLTLNISPWIMGQPYRIAALERLLGEIFAPEDVAAVTVADMLAASR
jgi:allantoinase